MGGGLLASHAVTRLGLRRALVLGPLLGAGGCLPLIYSTAAGMLGVVVVGNVLGGSGIGWTNVTTTIAGTAGLGPARQGLAAGLLTTAQQIGAAVGVSLASVVATLMPQQLGVGGHHAATAGEGAALVVALALAVAAGLLAGTPMRLTRSGAPRDGSERDLFAGVM